MEEKLYKIFFSTLGMDNIEAEDVAGRLFFEKNK